MSAPKVDSQVPPKTKTTRKRALSTSDAQETPAGNQKPAKRAKANTSTTGSVYVDLSGRFDILYTHPSFAKEYAPNGTGAANHVTRPEELYKMLLARQEASKDSWTAQISIPSNFQVLPNRGEVEFKNSVIIDPMMESPFELVATNFRDVAKPSFKTKYDRPTLEQGGCNAPGIKAALKIEGGGSCGIKTNSGTFVLRPMWRKVGDDGKVMELFEGNVAFKAKFNSLYSRKGFGRGIDYSFDFWAIRGEN